MRYCLLSRFQGAWLGSVLGEALATKNYTSDRLKIINYQTSQWSRLRNKMAKAIVYQQQLPTHLLPDSDCLSLVLLPLILLNHENLQVLQTALIPSNFANSEVASLGSRKLSVGSRERADMFKNVLLWGYTISLALREKLDVDNPIEQILTGVGVALTSNTLRELQTVDRALRQGRALNKIRELLVTSNHRQISAIALSMCCFADAPNDFYLAVSRARSIAGLAVDLQKLVTVMTATLSGAYNSLAGIPVNWQTYGKQNQIYRQEQKTAVNLFNNWLGVYLPQKPENHGNLTIVTTPKVIQPRSSLNLVSQTDY